MTTLKQIKPIFNFIKKNVRPTLCHIRVTKDSLECTDLETYIKIKDTFGLEQGYQNANTLGLLESVECEDYPVVVFDYDIKDRYRINIKDLEQYLKFTSKDETRLMLNGLAINNNHVVACDGHTIKFEEITGKKIENDYIIPTSSLQHLIRLCKKFKLENAVLELNEQFTTVDNGSFTIKMRNIQRDYVKWSTITPKSFKHELQITNWIDFKEIKPLFNPRSYGCQLKCVGGNLLLIIPNHLNNQYIIGKCSEDFEPIGFNVTYIERAINGSKVFTIKYNNELAPCEINECIIMPLKL